MCVELQARALRSLPCNIFPLWRTDAAVACIQGGGLLLVQAHGQGTDFCFATVHLESPIGQQSPLRPYFEQQRHVQAQQVQPGLCLCPFL